MFFIVYLFFVSTYYCNVSTSFIALLKHINILIIKILTIKSFLNILVL